MDMNELIMLKCWLRDYFYMLVDAKVVMEKLGVACLDLDEKINDLQRFREDVDNWEFEETE